MQMVLYVLSSMASLNDVLHAQISLTHSQNDWTLNIELGFQIAVVYISLRGCEFTHDLYIAEMYRPGTIKLSRWLATSY